MNQPIALPTFEELIEKIENSDSANLSFAKHYYHKLISEGKTPVQASALALLYGYLTPYDSIEEVDGCHDNAEDFIYTRMKNPTEEDIDKLAEELENDEMDKAYKLISDSLK